MPGDSLTFSGHARSIRVARVNSNADEPVTFTADGENLVVVGAQTGNLSVGKSVLLHDSGEIAGVHEILSINSDTEFVIGNEDGAEPTSAILVGHVVELDESLSSLTDDGLTQVYRSLRWFPISSVSGEVTPWRAAPPSGQPTLQGALSRDGLFFAGGDDPIYKFDGTEISRAGIPRMQVDLFLNSYPSIPNNGGKIPLNNPSVAFTSSSGNVYTLTNSDDIFSLRVGDEVEDSRNGESYSIIKVSDDVATPRITIDGLPDVTTPGDPGTLTRASVFRYYARLNMIDSNGGLLGSAAVGSEDLVVVLGADAPVYLRFHNFPKNLDSYDVDRMELQIYRTKANTAGPYYLLDTLPLKNELGDYVDYTDTVQDSVLNSNNLDEISSGLLGVELGTQWEGPIPSKFTKAVAGRLITANCIGWPKIDYVLRKTGNVTISASSMNSTTLGIKRDNTSVSEDQLFEFIDSFTPTAVAIAGVISGLTADTNYYLFTDSNDSPLTGCGWHLSNGSGQIDTGDAAFVGSLNAVKALLAGTIPVYVNDLTGTADHNWSKQFLIGSPASVEGQSVRRVTAAINWWQSTLSDSWLTAAAGGDFPTIGQMVLTTPVFEDTTFEATWTDGGGDISVFANGVLRDDTEQVSGFTRLFPSRVCVSEKNFPDIFNAPEIELDVNSRGVIDVNPSDGEEITGISSFFGDSTTSNSQRQSTLIVFKESSIYVADIATGETQKLETEGKGCTVPGSIVSTKGGIMFANLSGIYLLTPQFQTTFVGRRFDRKWKALGTADYSTAAGSLRNTENKWLLTK